MSSYNHLKTTTTDDTMENVPPWTPEDVLMSSTLTPKSEADHAPPQQLAREQEKLEKEASTSSDEETATTKTSFVQEDYETNELSRSLTVLETTSRELSKSLVHLERTWVDQKLKFERLETDRLRREVEDFERRYRRASRKLDEAYTDSLERERRTLNHKSPSRKHFGGSMSDKSMMDINVTPLQDLMAADNRGNVGKRLNFDESTTDEEGSGSRIMSFLSEGRHHKDEEMKFNFDEEEKVSEFDRLFGTEPLCGNVSLLELEACDKTRSSGTKSGHNHTVQRKNFVQELGKTNRIVETKVAAGKRRKVSGGSVEEDYTSSHDLTCG